MKRTKLRKILPALFCCAMLLSTTVFAYADESADTADAESTEAVIERSEEASTESNPLTVDGNGTLQDEAVSSQDKIFYTVTTKNNNTFFLIIDKQRTSDNVYMLSMIDEADLAEFLEEDTSSDTSSLMDDTDAAEPTITETPEPTAEQDTTQVEDTSEDSASNSTMNHYIGYILLAVLAVGAVAAYYVLKIRPKKDMDDDEDETAYGGEEQPDDVEEADEPEETSESKDTNTEAEAVPANEEGNVPLQDYPEVDDSDPSHDTDNQ